MEHRGGKHNREAVCWRAWSVCVFLLASVWHSGACFTVTSSEHKRRTEPGFWKTFLVKVSSWDGVYFEGWNATFAPLTVCFRMVWKNRASGWSLSLRIHYNPSFIGIVWPVWIKPPLTSHCLLLTSCIRWWPKHIIINSLAIKWTIPPRSSWRLLRLLFWSQQGTHPSAAVEDALITVHCSSVIVMLLNQLAFLHKLITTLTSLAMI